MSGTGESASFGKIRSVLWPIYSYELKKLLPMFFMFFCISFNYTILRDTKDALVTTAPNSGAEAIPFLKLWCVLPAAILLVYIYSRLSNVLSRDRLFYTMIAPFMAFFILFGFVLYPMRDVIHPTETAAMLREILPSTGFFRGLLAVFEHWSFSIYYVLAEMWGSMVLSMMFWGFANEITKTTEAKRFYGLLGIGANLALVVSGPVTIWASPGRGQPFGSSLQVLMTLTTISAALAVATYAWMNRYVLTDPRFYDPSKVRKKKPKTKMPMSESLKFLFQSRYLGCIAFMVMAYGLTINLIEVVWKGQVQMMYPDPADYTRFRGQFSTAMGLCSLVMFIFVSHNVLRRFGWTVAALITPVILMFTGTSFFGFATFRDAIPSVLMLGTSPLMMAVIFGAAQNVMTKSSKYSLFDPTKEMAYIPLDDESKVKGKAAIDVVGARLGKSGGSLILMPLMLFFTSITEPLPIFIVGCVVIGVGMGWIKSARTLGGLYHALVAEKEGEEALAAANDSEKSPVGAEPAKA
ncbi:MAG: Npt1/Npt2 family nucleotide transporter [Oligoflexales bacterium]